MCLKNLKEIIILMEKGDFKSFSNNLEQHYEVLEDGTTVIERCKDCGEIKLFKNLDGYDIYRDCKCVRTYRKQAKLQRFKDLSIIDRNYKSNIFSNSKVLKDTKEYDVYCELYKYTDTFNINKHGYIFTGNVGSGKTFLANCVCNMLEDKGFSVLSFNLGAYLSKIRITPEEEDKLLLAVKDVDMLFIDDLGSEYINRQNGSMWAEEKLFRLFDERYRAGKPIIITTNLNIEDIKEHLKINGIDKIYDRLVGTCKPIAFNWESKRKALN